MNTNSYERRRNCPAAHSTHTAVGWTRGDDESLGALRCNDGRWQYKLRCQRCATTGGPLPTAQLVMWGLTPDDIQWQRANPPRNYEPCTYAGCTVTPTEYHHFAPRNTFGADADSWPVLPLCRPHHHAWHQTMDGYRWHQKRVAA